MNKAIFAAACMAAALSVSPLLAQVENPIAPLQTSEGLVAGKVLPSGIKAWFGIPYAKPPLNELRWKPPQPISWKGVWNADRKMQECPQVLRPHYINNYFGEEAMGEDCLYLNIWAPANAAPGAALPVYFYIYGGGNTLGSASNGMWDGENMAKKGVIFVALNYRLGILGFMAHPELTREQGGHSGNYAHLDQLAALKWVHDNIARFGGDPARVTVHGQSAGAAAVGLLLHSPLAKGLFAGAVMSSTCSIGAGGVQSLADAEKIGLELQKRFGGANIEDLRGVAADKLVALQNDNQITYLVTNGVRVGSNIDGHFLTKSKEDTAKAHEMIDVPIIGNFNADESTSPLLQAKTVAEYRQIAAQMYGKDADDFLKLYPVKSDAEVHAMAAAAARENAIANASRGCAVNQALYNKSPAYIDMFGRKHAYAPGVKIIDQDVSAVGAYHNSDTSFWFNNLEQFNKIRHTRDWSDYDRHVSDAMSDALVAFAKTGDPATATLKWTAWSPKNDAFASFGDSIAMQKFNSKGMAWLAAHPAASVSQRTATAPGVIAGAGPRD